MSDSQLNPTSYEDFQYLENDSLSYNSILEKFNSSLIVTHSLRQLPLVTMPRYIVLEWVLFSFDGTQTTAMIGVRCCPDSSSVESKCSHKQFAGVAVENFPKYEMDRRPGEGYRIYYYYEPQNFKEGGRYDGF